jgi:flagellar basal-body rod protein FlgB
MGANSDQESDAEMGLFDITDLVLQRGLQGASLRQQVLANNLANANTSGFKRSDVDFHSALADALEQDAQTSSQSAVDGLSFAPKTDTQSTMRADGNNVDFDEENSSLTENAVEYEALLTVARARMQMLKTAMGGGQ